MCATIVILAAANTLKYIHISYNLNEMFYKIFPLPLLYLGNIITGLGSTKKLSLPMFTVLRRFSILMTMILEYIILRVKPSKWVQLSVFAMVFGAIIAASDDLAFDLAGYIMIFGNDIFTALNGVVVKKKLENKDLGKYALIFYNSFFMLPFAIAFSLYTKEYSKLSTFTMWNNPYFMVALVLSCAMGFILNYSVVLCTYHNSALTTTIIGCLKNMLVTYAGMIIGGDYIFSWPNFMGLNISIIGSIFYSYLTFFQKSSSSSSATNSKQSLDRVIEYSPVHASKRNSEDQHPHQGVV